MIDAKQIPLEVRNAISAARKNGASSAEIAASALNAWPGMGVRPHTVTTFASCIILPLPQDASDE